MKFGKEIKRQFLYDKSICFIAHGCYGLTVKPVMEERIRLMYEQENQPDKWFRVNLRKYYEKAVESAANFVGAKTENLVIVDNVSAGTNTVLKCLNLESEDQILLTSHTYSAVQKCVKELHDYQGTEAVIVKIPIPLKSEDEIVEAHRKALEENPKIKIAIIDHITSTSAMIMPVKKLIALCKKYGVLTLIDGAHAPGQIELHIEELGADFYSANFHKWCYAPRSCGFLWIAPEHQSWVRPLVTSHGYKESLHAQFVFLGARDISNLLSLPIALKFYGDIGGVKEVTRYADELLTWAQDMMCKELGTDKPDIPKEMRAPCLALIRFPIKYGSGNEEHAAELTKLIFARYNVQMRFCTFSGVTWARLLANVHNTKEDFVKVKDALLQYLEDE